MNFIKTAVNLLKKNKLKAVLILFLTGVLVFASINLLILLSTKDDIFEKVSDIKNTQAVLILGARVYDNGRMSDVLRDRVNSGLELYQAEKVNKILMSGDHGQTTYDEVNTVKDYLLTKGVPAEDIFLDHAGFDTYDSLYRAKHIFQIDSLVVATQKFHLPRAVYIGKSLAIETYGYISDKQQYLAATRNGIRESIARIKAFGNVIFHSKSKYLGDKIPISGNGQKSWD